MESNDPFDESRAELEVTLKQLASLRSAMQSALMIDLRDAAEGTSGGAIYGFSVDPEAELRRFASQLRRFQSMLSDIEEDHKLLSEVVDALVSRKAGPRGQTYNPGLLQERQQFVQSTARSLNEHRSFLEDATRRHKEREADYQAKHTPASAAMPSAPTASRAPATTSRPQRPESQQSSRSGFLDGQPLPHERDESKEYHQELEQLKREEQATLDSLHRGVTSLKHKAITINEEAEEQDNMLKTLEVDVTTLQGKVLLVNRRVNNLLDQMSQKSKVCCIIVLCVILGALLMILVST